MEKIFILGAGVAGMSAALKIKELDKNGKYEIILIEKEDRAGGLINSESSGDHWWDNGCYMFYSSLVFPKRYPHLLKKTHVRQTVWLNNQLYRFPFDVKEVLKKSSIKQNIGFIFSILWGNISKFFEDESNARNWLNHRVGRSMVNHTHLDNYLMKLQALSLDNVSSYLCFNRLKSIDKSVVEIASTMIKNKLKPPKRTVLNKQNPHSGDVIHYAKDGIRHIATEMENQCIEQKIPILKNAEVTNIEFTDNQYKITINDNETLVADKLISTLPLNDFGNIYKSEFSESSQKAFKYTQLHLTFLYVDKFKYDEDFMVMYAFEEEYNWKKLTAIKMDSGKYSIILESNYPPDENLNLEKIKNENVKSLIEKLKLFTENDIAESRTKVVKNAYPIFDLHVKERDEIMDFYNKNGDILFLGRQGSFQYFSAHNTITHAEKSVEEFLF
jgi:protoporphyrinogen oxidase